MTLSTSSWKTSSAGITLIVGAIVHLVFCIPSIQLWFQAHGLNEMAIMLALGGILAGVGLCLARDNDKSSVDVGADPISKSVALSKQAADLTAKAAAMQQPQSKL